MPATSTSAWDDLEPPEAFEQLVDLASRKRTLVPAELLAVQVMKVTQGGDWPLRREALDALLRRMAFAQADGLEVVKRPRQHVGEYKTAKVKAGGQRPYKTLLVSINPLLGSCDCPDFSRASLGLCKHLLAVLGDVFKSNAKQKEHSKQMSNGRQAKRPSLLPPREVLVAQLTASNLAALSMPEFTGSGLWWNPVRPLTGRGDFLMGVKLVTTPEQQAGRATKPAAGLVAVRRYFAQTSTELSKSYSTSDRAQRSRVWELIDSHEGNLRKRAELVQALRRALQASSPIDPALSRLLDVEAARLEEHQRRADMARRSKGLLKGLRRTLYAYQREGVRTFLEAGRLLLADDMGLGKTTQAIAGCHALYREGAVKRGLLIVPSPLKGQWLREWAATTTVLCTVVDGTPSERAQLYRKTTDGFLIINYEQLLRDLDEVRRFKPDMVVLDEAQRIKNWATKTAAYVKSLQPTYRLVLTGTPMENRLEELASLLDFVDDRAIEPKWRLASWHTVWSFKGDLPQRREAVGARNLDTLRQRLRPCMLRRVRQEVLAQLPSRTDVRVPVVMTDQQLARHADLDLPIARLLAISKRRPLQQAEFLKLMQLLTTQRIISNGLGQLEFESVWPTYRTITRPNETQLDALFSPKLHELRRLVQEIVLDQGRKVVVFSQWRRMLNLASWAVSDLLADAGLRSVFFTGAESQRQRTRNLVEMHDDPATRILFLSDAGGVGLNLQRAASCCINIELPWNPAVLEQRIARIHRLGQKAPIDVYNLISDRGIEARIADIVGSKRALFTGLFEGTSNEISFDGAASFLSQVERIVEVPEAPPMAVGSEDDRASDEVQSSEHESGDTVDELLLQADEGSDHSLEEKSIDAQQTRDHGALGDGGARASGGTPRRPLPTASELGTAFAGVRMERTKSGGLLLEAEPEAAASLAALFEGMATLMRTASRDM